ncbi:uncharacterized protein LOC143459238 [Clavelina lepadiformis]
MFVVLVTATTWVLFWRESRKTLKAKENKINLETIAGKSTRREEREMRRKSSTDRRERRAWTSCSRTRTENLTEIIVFMVTSFTACVLPFLAVQADSISPKEGELEHLKKYGRHLEEDHQPTLYSSSSTASATTSSTASGMS